MKKDRPVAQWPRKSMFKQIPLSIAVIDRSFRIVEVNRRFEKEFGNWRGENCLRLHKRRINGGFRALASKTFKDGRTRVSQEERQDAQGEAHHYMVYLSPFKDEKGEIPYLVELSIDITDRVNLEKEYRLLFDHVPCFVSVLDDSFRVVEANELFRKTFSREGAQYCYEMYKGRDTVCPKCPAVRVFKTKKTCTSLQVGLDKEGNKTHYMVTASPFRIQGDRVDRVIEMAHNVSDIMRLQEQIKRIEQEKLDAERFAAVGQTVAGLAHGIKNILMGLEGGIYVVNSGLSRGDMELMANGWNMLQTNIKKTSTVVKEYLQFARGAEIKVDLANPAHIAAEVTDLYRDAAQRSGIELVSQIKDNLREAPLDHEGIHSCLANLVSNAIDACNMSDKKSKKITLSCLERNGTIVYEVKDNGTGMDYEVKKKLFTNFFTTKASGQGTGLGLLVTRRIIHEHGGKIGFESAYGKGSLFRIELPRKRLPKIKKEALQEAQ